jgi:hypothetical protein
MTGRDRSVGWCFVETDYGRDYLLPRSEYDRLSALVTDRIGWYSAVSVFGSSVMFRIADVRSLEDCSPASIAAAAIAQAEDENEDA